MLFPRLRSLHRPDVLLAYVECAHCALTSCYIGDHSVLNQSTRWALGHVVLRAAKPLLFPMHEERTERTALYKEEERCSEADS